MKLPDFPNMFDDTREPTSGEKLIDLRQIKENPMFDPNVQRSAVTFPITQGGTLKSRGPATFPGLYPHI